MTDQCPLDAELLDRLLAGELGDAEARTVTEHLASDCDGCDALLDQVGLDEETLTLYLLAAESEPAAKESLDRVWSAIASQTRTAESPTTMPPRPLRRTRSPRLVERWSWGFGGMAVAAAAALLLVVVWPASLNTPYDGVKGSAPLPRASLSLHSELGPIARSVTEGEVVEVRYGLERAAWAKVFHPSGAAKPELLFDGRLPPAWPGLGRVSVSGGHLGFDFSGETGVHAFFLVISETHLDVHHFEAGWLSQTEQWREVRLGENSVGIALVRVEVQPASE